MKEESLEVIASSFCAVFTRGPRHGGGKNRLETQRERMQIDFMFAKSATLQKHYRSKTINKARSVGADEDDFVS